MTYIRKEKKAVCGGTSDDFDLFRARVLRRRRYGHMHTGKREKNKMAVSLRLQQRTTLSYCTSYYILYYVYRSLCRRAYTLTAAAVLGQTLFIVLSYAYNVILR